MYINTLNDIEILIFIQKIAGGDIYLKKNYNPKKHKDSYTLYFKKKKEVFNVLNETSDFLRVNQKRKRAKWILDNYDNVTPRNGKYNEEMLKMTYAFEKNFLNFDKIKNHQF